MSQFILFFLELSTDRAKYTVVFLSVYPLLMFPLSTLLFVSRNPQPTTRSRRLSKRLLKANTKASSNTPRTPLSLPTSSATLLLPSSTRTPVSSSTKTLSSLLLGTTTSGVTRAGCAIYSYLLQRPMVRSRFRFDWANCMSDWVREAQRMKSVL